MIMISVLFHYVVFFTLVPRLVSSLGMSRFVTVHNNFSFVLLFSFVVFFSFCCSYLLGSVCLFFVLPGLPREHVRVFSAHKTKHF